MSMDLPLLPCIHPSSGGKEVVVSRKCGEAVLRGAPVYVPGVIAASPGIEKGDLVTVSIILERPGRCGKMEDRYIRGLCQSLHSFLTSHSLNCSEWCGVTRGTVIGSEAWVRAGHLDRQGLFLGVGRMSVGRSELFRSERGVALLMDQPVFKVPSAQGQ